MGYGILPSQFGSSSKSSLGGAFSSKIETLKIGTATKQHKSSNLRRRGWCDWKSRPLLLQIKKDVLQFKALQSIFAP
ncbi:hypothetical protein L195_g030745, partial [Trifolium pratense]